MRGRIRSIKPESCLDEELWDAEQRTGLPLYRCFTGLWMYADREGRFEWRPRALKTVILPYWSGEMEDALEALSKERFIEHYKVDGKEYGLVCKFLEHQTPNHKEPPSKIPPPARGSPGLSRESPVLVPVESGTRDDSVSHPPQEDPPPGPGRPATSGNGLGTEGNGREGEGSGACAPKPSPTLPPGLESDMAKLEADLRSRGAAALGSAPPASPSLPPGMSTLGSALGAALRPAGTSSYDRSKAKLDGLIEAGNAANEAAARGDWTAQHQSNCFRRAFEAVQRTMANMGGKTVGSFHADVLRTAELQERDPGELFAETLTAWLARGLNEMERRAPYACFHGAWGELTSKGATRDGDYQETSKEAWRKAMAELDAHGQSARYQELAERAKRIKAREDKS